MKIRDSGVQIEESLRPADQAEAQLAAWAEQRAWARLPAVVPDVVWDGVIVR